MSQMITLVGAREHNLKDVAVEIPRNQFTVITGLSGSGKSSLAFDTIYAEGQRRYVESLSPYARQFLEKMKKPDVDKITGLSPSISIEQKHITKNPRSTVGTITEIYDYLRLLFAKIGDITCYQCGSAIAGIGVEQMYDQVMSLGHGINIMVLAPLVRERKGEFKDVLEKVRKLGFSKVVIDGALHDIHGKIKLAKAKRHNLDVVVARLRLCPETSEELRASLEQALAIGTGTCRVEIVSESGASTSKTRGAKKARQFFFSEKLYCANCQVGYEELTPNLFSFNSSVGACPSCKGIGVVAQLIKGFVIVDETKPILGGAINKEINFSFNKYFISELVHDLKQAYAFDLRTPFRDLPEEVKEAFFWGSADHYGIVDELKDLLHNTDSENIKSKIRKFLKEEVCQACHGGRLSPKSLGIKLAGENIVSLSEQSLDSLVVFFENLPLRENQQTVAQNILQEIRVRLAALKTMGLGYLTLSRAAATLSGGEVQRVRLASQIGTGLTGVLYVLDEPSIGLHPRDNRRLLELLEELKRLNNTVIVVEHDEETMLKADFLIDMGPGAGEAGGRVNFAVPQAQLSSLNVSESLTLQYLRRAKKIPVPEMRKAVQKNHQITLSGVSEHNLKNLRVKIPLGLFVCVTGVSGSGKSTLVHDVLYKAIHNRIWKTDYKVGKIKSLLGAEKLDKVIEIDQSPIGRTSRSNPATYIDVFTPIRNLFSQLPEAKIKGFSQGRFSFNVKGGRCEACEGAGFERLEMSFLPDVAVTCDICGGKRFNQETLSIAYRGKNIAEVLDLAVSEALDFFKAVPQIHSRLEVLVRVGLGYIRLGQPSTTLSGGEAQRIKIAFELCRKSTGKTLYILDEPTTGLHFADIHCLLEALLALREGGNSVLVIEHNLDVIKVADYVLDLGPEGGEAGGEVIACGTPEEICRVKESYTGKYLKAYLS